MSWPSRYVRLSHPSTLTGVTGKSAHCGNWPATRRRTSATSIPARPSTKSDTSWNSASHVKSNIGGPMFDVEIRTAEPDAPGIEPGTVVVQHHLTDRAQITVDTLSGGHLLHLAVAGCLFNDILRAAGQRGIPITDLRISADGR